jgi:hypothetical protein
MRFIRITVAATALAVGLGSIAADASARPARHAPAAVALSGPIVVDVSRLRQLGLGPTADVVQDAVLAELRPQPLPASGRLVVRVDALSLSAFAGPDSGGGGGSDGGGGGADFDYMQGEALIVGPGGEILRRAPINMSLPSSSGGAYYLPGVDRRRIVELSRNFARWVGRELG